MLKGLGCAQECFRDAAAVENPWYGRESQGQRPDYGDPIAGQVNRYMATTTNTCPNPNIPMSFQSNVGSGYLASNLQLSAGDDTIGDIAGDTTMAPGSSSDMFGVQANTQKQNHPDTLNQAYSSDNALRFEEANALLPSTAADHPNTADNIPALFPDTRTDNMNLNQLSNTKKTVIGSGRGTTMGTTSINGDTGSDLGTGIGTIGTTVGTTIGDTSPKTFNFATLGHLPLFRKRDAKSARDFRL